MQQYVSGDVACNRLAVKDPSVMPKSRGEGLPIPKSSGHELPSGAGPAKGVVLLGAEDFGTIFGFPRVVNEQWPGSCLLGPDPLQR